MQEKIKAYSYLRISTDAQKVGDGIRRQIESGQKYAQEHGYELVETYRDLGVSGFKGKNAKEGAFGRFLAAIDDGTVAPGSVLIVESLDRLSRAKVLEAFTQFSSLLSKGITIVTLIDGQEYTDEGVSQNANQLFTSLGIMLRANDESATKSKRLKALWKKKRDMIADQKMTKMIPAWLELNEDRTEFIIKEDAAELVRTIYDLCINGMGIYTITRHLNGNIEKYPAISGAKRWNDSYISKILRNPAVYGAFQPHQRVDGKSQPVGDPILDYYPTIVAKDEYFLAQSRMKERRKGGGRKGEGLSNLFTGLTICGKCGGNVVMKDKGKPPKGFKYLRCHNSLLNSGCQCPAWRYSDFEDVFIKFVHDVSFSEVFEKSSSGNKKAQLDRERDTVAALIAEKRANYEALVSRFETPELSEMLLSSLVARSNVLEAEIGELEAQSAEIAANIQRLSSEDATQDQVEFLEGYADLVNEGEPEALRETRFRMHDILRRNIDRIEVHNGTYFEPWEDIPDSLRAELAGKGIVQVKDIETFLSKPHGKRVRDKHDRYFVVHFKNGVTRRVSNNYSVLDVSKGDITMIKQFQKR